MPGIEQSSNGAAGSANLFNRRTHKGFPFQNISSQRPWNIIPSLVDTGSSDELLCHCCNKVLESRQALQRHISTFHPETLPFTCNICGKGMHTKRGLELHEFTHGERKFMCPFCDSKFKFKHHLKGHLHNIHNTKMCPHCSLPFNLEDFNTHILTCH